MRARHRFLCATLPATMLLMLVGPARATQSASLTVSLNPDQPGAPTTISFAFAIKAPTRQLPSPLTSIALSYPKNVGIVTSGLGLATCTTQELETDGPEGCPPNALMGTGSATVGIAFGPEILYETGEITIWMAPVEAGEITLIVNAETHTPVMDDLILPSQLLAAPAPYGGTLQTPIPPLTTLPGAPNGSILTMHATLGPKNLTYYERKDGRRVPYHPAGIILPSSCPHDGFPFTATFKYENGTADTSARRIPCRKSAPPKAATHRHRT